MDLALSFTKRIVPRVLSDAATSELVQELVDAVNALPPPSAEIEVEFEAMDTDTLVRHGLPRVATRYYVVSKSAATDVYDGSVAAERGQLYLRASVPATVTLVVF